MQSALRSAARRAATNTTTTKAAAAADTVAAGDREWVTTLVQREVRAEMRAAKEQEALAAWRAAAKEQEALAAAKEREALAAWLAAAAQARQDGYYEWGRGFSMGYTSCLLLWVYVTVLSHVIGS